MNLRISFRRVKPKHWLILAVLLYFTCDYFGVLKYFQQLSYDRHFSYPYEGDVHKFAQMLKAGETPPVAPVYGHDYFLYKSPNSKCLSEDGNHYEQLRVLFLVKSALANADKREAIRKTWGYEKRFSDVPIRTVFLLGHAPHDVRLQAQVQAESQLHGDIVQGNFVDTYFNNTVKSAMGLRWAVETCPKSRFYMFVDDDYYVSTRNLLRYLRNPLNYPGYLQEDVISFDENEQKEQFRQAGRHLNQMVDFDLPQDVRLYTGFVFSRSRPHRHKSSKWYVDLLEYPFNYWPPYVTAGAYVLSRDALVDMYFTSYYTKMFRFDDIWLGLVAKKAGIVPFHSPEFHFYPAPYTVNKYKYVVASHGFSEPIELLKIWSQQKEAGNA